MTPLEELAALQAELTVHARRLDTIIRRIDFIKLRLEQPTTPDRVLETVSPQRPPEYRGATIHLDSGWVPYPDW